ncbi:hypothetical protein BCR43DRAFT_497765 [Syncephalastrum racemosum]|uniref:Uncharacterized protein n=1 Tax=Syncephalastrum racemosum TaxID=13706 RepID=A0A1X2H2P9_SYNRA|nr:hypothetical protein BCR43DRAFT_497765 [Syncephalastrum racemosum]
MPPFDYRGLLVLFSLILAVKTRQHRIDNLDFPRALLDATPYPTSSATMITEGTVSFQSDIHNHYRRHQHKHRYHHHSLSLGQQPGKQPHLIGTQFGIRETISAAAEQERGAPTGLLHGRLSSSAADTDALYIITDAQRHQGHSAPSIIWRLAWTADSWTRVGRAHVPLIGHSAVLHDGWLLSCFGSNTGPGCSTCFNTRTLQAVPCHNHGSRLPPNRIDAAITPATDEGQAIIHGGYQEETDTYLSDAWQLDMTQAPLLYWNLIEPLSVQHISARAGHRATWGPSTAQVSVVIQGGLTAGQLPARPSTQRLMLTPASDASSRIRLQRRAPPSDEQQTKSAGLGGGAVGGIVVGVLAFVGIAIGLFVWMRRYHYKRQLHFHHKSRAARFSLSSPMPSRPTSSVKNDSRSSLFLANQQQRLRSSLPEVRCARLSTLSLGSEFRISHDGQRPSSLRNSIGGDELAPPMASSGGLSASYASVTMPQSPYDTRIHGKSQRQSRLSIVAHNSNDPPLRPTSRQEETATVKEEEGDETKASSPILKRLTLNFSSAWRPSGEPSPSPVLKRYTVAGDPAMQGQQQQRRRSSFFGLRLPQPASSTAATKSTLGESSRQSMRSVASVQWVGFNDTMDYKEQQWNPSVQLAVTNARRSLIADDDATYQYYSNNSSSMLSTRSRGSVNAVFPPPAVPVPALPPAVQYNNANRHSVQDLHRASLASSSSSIVVASGVASYHPR